MSLFTQQMKDQRPRKRSNLISVKASVRRVWGAPPILTTAELRRKVIELSSAPLTIRRTVDSA